MPVAEIAEGYAKGIETLDDLRGSTWYRTQMIRVHVRRNGFGREFVETLRACDHVAEDGRGLVGFEIADMLAYKNILAGGECDRVFQMTPDRQEFRAEGAGWDRKRIEQGLYEATTRPGRRRWQKAWRWPTPKARRR